MRLSFANQTVERMRATVVTDRYGNETRDWDNPQVTTVSNCIVAPMSGEETLSLDGQHVISRWKLDVPEGTDIISIDRVRYDDREYEIDGWVQHWPSPTGRIAHVEAVLKRVGSE